jgi:type I restriction enzyme S subunit
MTPDDWGHTVLADVVEPDGLQTGPFGAQLHASDYTTDGVPVVMPKDLAGGRIVTDSVARVPEQVAAGLERHRVASGDVLFGRRGDIGRCGLVMPEEEGWLCGTGCLRARVDQTKVHPPFLIQQLSAPAACRWLTENAVGQTMLNLNTSILACLPIGVPPLPEQRKIAAILSSVDEAIEATQAVIDQLQVVKKAMMAELLTRGIPGRHTRFKMTEIGEVPEEWEAVPLFEACEFLDGKRVPIKSSDREAMRGSIPYYGASGIIDWVNDHLFDESLVLLAEDGANIITRSTPVAFKVVGKCWVNNHAHVLRPRQGIDPDFLVQYLESLDYSGFSTGTAQPKLNQAVCQRIPVPLPSQEEQAEIGTLIRTFGERYAAELGQLEALRTLKSYLMSVLLTGEVRVQPDEDVA